MRIRPLAKATRSADDAESDCDAGRWEKVRPRTLVGQAADAIVAAIARGLILPGDRIVEHELANALGTSRVPVREALRLLESRGLVISEPYKGMRLAPLTRVHVDEVIEVRVALETIAARRALALGRNGGSALRSLERVIDEMELMALRQDGYGLADADIAFHRMMCRLAGNQVLCTVWESIALQMTIIVGLSTLSKPMIGIIQEHRKLLEVFAKGNVRALDRAIEEHVRVQTTAVDFERLIAERRHGRTRLPN